MPAPAAPTTSARRPGTTLIPVIRKAGERAREGDGANSGGMIYLTFLKANKENEKREEGVFGETRV